MPAKEIKELRQAGKLDEAYDLAKAELEADPENIWPKRNMSWVLYSQLDAASTNFSTFLEKLRELKDLDLPQSEEMLFDNVSIVISKAARSIAKENPIDYNKAHALLDSIKEIPLKRNSKWFSVLFQAMHRALRESYRYIEFADWWNFENFRQVDFEKEKLPDGKEVMSIVEQAYIAYAKRLLAKEGPFGTRFNREKAEAFIIQLDNIIANHPVYQYPPYYKAKLLLALGDSDNMLSALLPFARKRRNDFWVWEIFSETFQGNDDNILACYCRALLCTSPEEMLVSLRQKMAALLVKRMMYNEAKTEIDLLLRARNLNGWRIPSQVSNWQAEEWYKNSTSRNSNIDLYKQHANEAESLLYNDLPEEKAIITFVNKDARILNFISEKELVGFFKYDRFLKSPEIGQVLKVRFRSGQNNELFQVYTVTPTDDDAFRANFIRSFEGIVRIPEGKSFGFVNDIFVHPSIASKLNLTSGMSLKGSAIKNFNAEKKEWGWKMIAER